MDFTEAYYMTGIACEAGNVYSVGTHGFRSLTFSFEVHLNALFARSLAFFSISSLVYDFVEISVFLLDFMHDRIH